MTILTDTLAVGVAGSALGAGIGYVLRDFIIRGLDHVLHRQSYAVQVEIRDLLKELVDKERTKGYYEL